MFYPNQMSFGPPFADRVSLSNVSFADPWLTFPGVPGFSPAGRTDGSISGRRWHRQHRQECAIPDCRFYVNTVENLDKKFKQMYVNLWNLSVQRQVGTWLLTANYVVTARST